MMSDNSDQSLVNGGDSSSESEAGDCENNRHYPRKKVGSNRPKSALRRRTVDREEGDNVDDEDEEDSDEEFDHSAYEKFFQEGEFDSDKPLGEDIIILQSGSKGQNVAQINNKGVQDLFSDILFPVPDDSEESEYPIHIQRLLEESSRILSSPPPPTTAPTLSHHSYQDKPRRMLNSAPDGVESFAKDEKQWMERVLKRQKLDAEGQAHIALIQDDNLQQMRPRQLFSTGYPELQKATGLRVLRRVVERQQSLERDDENFLRQLRQTAAPSSATSSNGESQFSRKPPARLKPLNIDND